MKLSLRYCFIGILVFSFVILAGTQSAHALATLRLINGATVIEVGDGCTVATCGYLDSNSAVGAVTYVGAVGADWWLNVATGVTYTALGSPSSPQMDLSDISMTSNGTSNLTILFSQDGFSYSDPSAEFISSASVTTDGTATFNAYFDNDNALFAKTTAIGTLGPFAATFPDESFSGTTNAYGSTDGNYSITQEAIITHTAGGQNSSYNYVVNVVPEPVSTTLFIVGGMTLGFRKFRKRAKT